MTFPLLPRTSAVLRTAREAMPLFPNAIQAALFDELHTIGDLKVLPSTAGGFLVFRDGMPNGCGIVQSGLRTEQEAHAALLLHAGRGKGKPR